MALQTGQFLVPDKDLNDITIGYTLRTIQWDDRKTLAGRPQAAVTPKSLPLTVPWSSNIPFTVISTP